MVYCGVTFQLVYVLESHTRNKKARVCLKNSVIKMWYFYNIKTFEKAFLKLKVVELVDFTCTKITLVKW